MKMQNKKNIWIFMLLLGSLFGISGCTTQEKQGADIGARMSDSEYTSVIDQNTRHFVKYEGFYQKFEIYATFVNSNVQSAMLQRLSDTKLWGPAEAQKERERMFQENTTQTKFVISFFVPSTRLNDLHKGASIWEIYLESNGQKYRGKAMRRNGKLEDIQSIIPYHNRWSIPYDITFDTPLSGVESGSAKFIITSSQGAAELAF